MGTATIRLDDELLQRVRRFGVNLSEAARSGIQDAVRRAEMIAAGRRLAKLAVKPDETSEQTIRRLRDERR